MDNPDYMDYMEIREHTHRKYTILEKYLRACEKFHNKYQNFVYVDTHGGTGKVVDLNKGERIDGSTRIAGKITPQFPCHSIEINPKRYELLENSAEDFSNIETYLGNCNQIIDDILEEIPTGQKFVFFFIDPNGLKYDGNGFSCNQVEGKTLDKIINFPRSEILLNLPVRAIMGHAGSIKKKESSSKEMAKRLTNLFGSEEWMKVNAGDYRRFLRLFISERFERNFTCIGAILIRTENLRGPLYYLVFGSNHEVGGKIMRHTMMKELEDMLGMSPLTKHQYETVEEWLDSEYPLDLFIFED